MVISYVVIYEVVIFMFFGTVQFSNLLQLHYVNMPFLLPFISFLFHLKTRTAPHILAEKKRHIQIAPFLVSLLLIHHRDTRISEASLTKSYWWLTTSQRRCGKNNLQREEDDADSCSYLKDKAWGGCWDHQRGGDQKKKRKKDKIEYPMHQKDWTLSIHQPGV